MSSNYVLYSVDFVLSVENHPQNWESDKIRHVFVCWYRFESSLSGA